MIPVTNKNGTSSSRRYLVIGGPSGHLSVRPVGCPMLDDRYRGWQVLARVNVPRSVPKRWGYPDTALANALKSWTLRTFELV